MPDKGFLSYMEDGEEQDAAIHDAILAEGDDDAATEVSIRLMQDLGLTRDEALSLLPPRLKPKSAKTFARMPWAEPRAFDPDQPRDEGGRWTSGGGGGGGSTGAADKPSAPPAGPANRPQIKEGPQEGNKPSRESMQKVSAAVAAIPVSHAELLKDVPITVTHSTGGLNLPYGAGAESIYVGETVPLQTKMGNRIERQDIPVKSVEGETVRQLGFAYDTKSDGNPSKEVWPDVERAMLTRVVMADRGTPQSKAEEYFYAGPIKERMSFAELYSLAHNPDQNATYFAGMSRERASTVFKEALAKVKAMK